MTAFRTTLTAVCAAALLTPALAGAEGLADLFPEGLRTAAGEELSLDALKDKPVVGIYFSAHWCGPCRSFTPTLVKYRDSQQDNFEVVFVSSDRSEEDQFKYMKEAGMKWPTLKYKSKAADALKEKYAVRGIPTLVLVNGQGETITKDGRAMVNDKVPASKLATAKIVQEEYKCPNCDKMHTRSKVVFADDEKAEKKTDG